MNEEEKKAIERLEEQLNFWKKQNIKNSDCEIILNLITKLQKENEEKDKIIYEVAKSNVSRELKIDSATISNCCNGKRKSAGGFKWRYVQDEIPRLNLVIDLMAEYWNTGLAMCDDCEKIVEKYEKNNCKDCIKQYFERKVEDVKD